MSLMMIHVFFDPRWARTYGCKLSSTLARCNTWPPEGGLTPTTASLPTPLALSTPPVSLTQQVHPSPGMMLYPGMLAREMLQVTYHGVNAHAASNPWQGVNALDATVQGYTNVAMMRQQFKPSWRRAVSSRFFVVAAATSAPPLSSPPLLLSSSLLTSAHLTSLAANSTLKRCTRPRIEIECGEMRGERSASAPLAMITGDGIHSPPSKCIDCPTRWPVIASDRRDLQSARGDH